MDVGQVANPGISIQGLCQGQTQVGRGMSIAPPQLRQISMCGIPVPAHHHFSRVLLHQAIEGRGSIRAMLQDEEALGSPEELITPTHCP